MGEKSPQNNFKIWNGLQGSQESSLAQRLVRVIRAGFNERSEILDTVYLIAGKKQTSHLPYIKPMIGGIFDTAVIQVETVNVDVCFHKPKTQRPP